MKRIKKFTEVNENLNEGNLDSLKVILQNLKDASEEEINKICSILNPRLTFGLIHDMAEVVGVEDKIKK